MILDKVKAQRGFSRGGVRTGKTPLQILLTDGYGVSKENQTETEQKRTLVPKDGHRPTSSSSQPQLKSPKPKEKEEKVDVLKGWQPLHYAIKLNKTEIAEVLLKEVEDFALQTPDGLNVLDVAMTEANLDIIKELWPHVVAGKLPINLGYLPSDRAVIDWVLSQPEAQDRSVLERFIDNDTAQTFVHKFLLAGQIRQIESIVGSDPVRDIGDADGNSPLHYAIEADDLDSTKLLLNCGSSPLITNCPDPKVSADIVSALGLALEKSNPETVDTVLRSVDGLSDDDTGPLLRLTKRKKNLPEVLELLKAMSVDWNCAAPDGTTLLLASVQSKRTDLLKALVEDKDILVNPDLADSSKTTPLMAATKIDHLEATKLLLQLSPNINLVDDNKMTALHHVKSLAMATAILAAPGALEATKCQDAYGNTAVMHHAIRRDFSLTQSMLSAGSSVGEQNNDGQSILHLVAKCNDIDSLSYLTEVPDHQLKGTKQPSFLSGTKTAELPFSMLKRTLLSSACSRLRTFM
jgi:ankyrin repeat protein